MNNKKSLVIDGNYMMFQSFYATYRGDISSILKTSKGIPTNAVSVFLSQLVKLIKFINPDNLMIAFDANSKTKRHEIFPEYKSGRTKAPVEIFEQFDIIKKLLSLLNIKWIEKAGDEADDIIGTYCKKMIGKKFIFSSDKDLLQLVDEDTSYIVKKGIEISLIDNDNFHSIYEINPSQITTYKGLKGDSSDNLPGVKGIGDKTAIKLINTYGYFENIYKNLDEGTLKETKGTLEKLIKGRSEGFLSYELSKINTNVLELPLENDFYQINLNYDDAKSYIKELELQKFEKDLINLLKKYSK
ncbi:DNA polymerase I [Mycoplasmopsis canis PG 14]|uniref:5'-3' exonuclease n=1 Tax=Mycoplasmopsis canis TaxID=29555 RepID=A0A449AQS8_9BACT|nr:5'-3' exonuclease H3TH domain-containing protein [Mycoplasmopsis canis]AMD81049.1 DNA polymerase I [Mycoplasmopsis canis PG 14]EIE39892.1 DNA polymerase I [Mycoplasmopsis canis PG 14]VEU68861.1 Putative DNA polymerase I [Mycoplasmopsis canis]